MKAFYLLIPVLLPLSLAFVPVRQLPRLKNALPAIAAGACLLLALIFMDQGEVLSLPWAGGTEFRLRLTLSRGLFLFLLYALSLPPLVYHAVRPDAASDKLSGFCLLSGLAAASVMILAGNAAVFAFAWLLAGVNYYIFVVRGGSVAAQAAGLRLILVHSIAGLFAGAGLLLSNNAMADMLIYGWTEVSAARAQTTALALMLTAVFIKAGIFPFNGWSAEAAEHLPPGGPAVCFGVTDKIIAAVLMFKAFSDEVPLSFAHAGVVTGFCAVSMLASGLAAFFETRLKYIAFYASACGAVFIALACAGHGDVFRFACAAAAMTTAAASSAMLLAARELESGAGISDCASAAGAFKASPLAAWIFVGAGMSVSGLVPFAMFYPSLLVASGLSVYLFPAVVVVAAGQLLCFGAFVKVIFSMRREAAAEIGAPPAKPAVKAALLMSAACVIALWICVPLAVIFLLPDLEVFERGPWLWAAVLLALSALAVLLACRAGRAAGERPFTGIYGNLSSNPKFTRIINTLGRETLYLYPASMHMLFSLGRFLYSLDRLAGFITGTVPAYCTELVSVIISRLNRGKFALRFIYLLTGILVFLLLAIIGGAQ